MSCFICKSEADCVCRECGIKYCKHHEIYHKDLVEGGCFSFLVEDRGEVGRIMLATKDLEPGDIVFREKPMVLGPSKRSRPVCLGCCDNLETCDEAQNYSCSGCGWAICSEACPQLSNHTQKECEIIKNSEKISDSLKYGAILPLRVLLLGEKDLQYYLQFMDHCDLRASEQPEEHLYNNKIKHVLMEIWSQKESFSDELVSRVIGILDVNTVEHRVSESETTQAAREFLPITSLASHSCVSNSFKDKCDPGYVTTRAKIRIAKGDEITFHYTGGLKGRLVRRPLLRKNWYFWCTCDRCCIEDELETNFSTIVCSQVNGGCGSFARPSTPQDDDSNYRCENCDKIYDRNQVQELEKAITDKIESCYRHDSRGLAVVLLESQKLLHSNHYLVLILKWLLLTTLGRVKGQEYDRLPEQTLTWKIQLCEEYLRVLDILDPGISHNRGITLWELYSSQTYLLNKHFKEETISASQFLSGLRKSVETVEKARFALQYSQDRTTEANIVKSSGVALDNLERTIAFFSNIIH